MRVLFSRLLKVFKQSLYPKNTQNIFSIKASLKVKIQKKSQFLKKNRYFLEIYEKILLYLILSRRDESNGIE